MKILYVEDEKDTAKTVQDLLKKQYLVDVAFCAKDADYLAYINSYDLIILDVILPDMDGISLCQSMRKNGLQSYIVMLTGKTDVSNKVLALNEGADDYITKPFHIDELQARIKALTRRRYTTSINNILTLYDLTIDTGRKLVMRANTPIKLRRKEYDLLEYFVRNAGKIFTRSMILDNVWDSASDPLGNTVDVHIKYLRDKIDKPFDKKLIQTVYGLGYRLVE